MGVILFVVLFPICLVAISRRRRSGKSVLVPTGVAAYAILMAAWSVLAMIQLEMGIAAAHDPSTKAMRLAHAISQAMNRAALGLIVDVPLLVAAYFVDRWLMKRSATRDPRP